MCVLLIYNGWVNMLKVMIKVLLNCDVILIDPSIMKLEGFI